MPEPTGAHVPHLTGVPATGGNGAPEPNQGPLKTAQDRPTGGSSDHFVTNGRCGAPHPSRLLTCLRAPHAAGWHAHHLLGDNQSETAHWAADVNYTPIAGNAPEGEAWLAISTP